MQQKFNKTTFRCAIYWVGVNIWGGGGEWEWELSRGFFSREHFQGHRVCMYTIYGIKYSRMGQVKFFKSCLSQSLLFPFLRTLSHICHIYG